MNVLVAKNLLVPVLNQAQTVVEKKTNSQQLMNVCLQAKGNELIIYATDLEVSLVAHIPCEVHSEGFAVVSAHKLYEVVRELADKPIHLIGSAHHWLDVQQEKFRSKILGLPTSEYPLFVLNPPDQWQKIKGQTLKKMIQKTEYAVSNDTTRIYLSGIFVEYSKGVLSFVATDGHRLALNELEFPNFRVSSLEQGVIIPKKGISEIKKLIDGNSTDEVEIATDRTQFFVQRPDMTLGIRLIDGKFPRYRSLLPQNKLKVPIPKNEFALAIRRVSLFSSYKSKAITLIFQNNNLAVNANNLELGDARDEIEIKYDGPEIQITYNPAYLLDAINNIEEEIVEFHIDSEERPTLIKGEKDSKFINIVMPMRI